MKGVNVEQVYRIGFLRDKVVAQLRATAVGASEGLLAQALALPGWAVNAGLEAAQAADMVEFVAPGVWRLKGR